MLKYQCYKEGTQSSLLKVVINCYQKIMWLKIVVLKETVLPQQKWNVGTKVLDRKRRF